MLLHFASFIYILKLVSADILRITEVNTPF